MGEELYDEIVDTARFGFPCRVYAPVGNHKDLLPYLVRRLLENGANTSFVNRIVDEKAPIEEIVADLREGRMVIIVDDEDRENEGDLIMAATRVRPEDVNFMARYGRGLICLTLTRERCTQLRLPLMPAAAHREITV